MLSEGDVTIIRDNIRFMENMGFGEFEFTCRVLDVILEDKSDED